MARYEVTRECLICGVQPPWNNWVQIGKQRRGAKSIWIHETCLVVLSGYIEAQMERVIMESEEQMKGTNNA